MHEVSLVRSLLRQVREIADREALTSVGPIRVRQIHVSVGLLSGVEPLLVEEAFTQLAPAFDLADAALKLDEVGLAATCRDCGEAFSTPELRFECPACRSASIRVTGGDDFRLLDVTLETSELDPAPSFNPETRR